MTKKSRRGEGEEIAIDVKENAFRDGWEKLSSSERKVIFTIVSRIAERSYRRGVQHGVSLERQGLIDMDDLQLSQYRYEIPLDAAPPAARIQWSDLKKHFIGRQQNHKHQKYKSWYRLKVESNPALERLGINCPFDDD